MVSELMNVEYGRGVYRDVTILQDSDRYREYGRGVYRDVTLLEDCDRYRHHVVGLRTICSRLISLVIFAIQN